MPSEHISCVPYGFNCSVSTVLAQRHHAFGIHSGTDVGSHLCSVLMDTAYTSFGEDSDF